MKLKQDGQQQKQKIDFTEMYSFSSCFQQKTACDETNIRTCMDELKEIADSAGDNFHADIFIQLRHYLAKQDPGVLTHDDQLFKSPIRNLGQTNTEYRYHFHEDVWKAR